MALKLRVEGQDRIPASGPAILAANHVSPLDPIAVALAAARRGRTVRYLTAVEAYDIPVIGWGLKRFRQIPIRRGARDAAALAVGEPIPVSGDPANEDDAGALTDRVMGAIADLVDVAKLMARDRRPSQ